MQTWRRLRHWSIPSSIMLCSTPTHTSIRCRLKSFTSCAFFWSTRCPRLCNETYLARAVWWSEIWRFIASIKLLLFWTGIRQKKGQNNQHVHKWYAMNDTSPVLKASGKWAKPSLTITHSCNRPAICNWSSVKHLRAYKLTTLHTEPQNSRSSTAHEYRCAQRPAGELDRPYIKLYRIIALTMVLWCVRHERTKFKNRKQRSS